MKCSRAVLRIVVRHVAIRLVAVGPSRRILSPRDPVVQMQRPTFVLPLVEEEKHRSTTPVAHRLVREGTRHTRHNNVQRSADVHRHSSSGVGARGDSSADNAHDSVQADGNAVAGPTVS
jgi:hypothetical protein